MARAWAYIVWEHCIINIYYIRSHVNGTKKLVRKFAKNKCYQTSRVMLTWKVDLYADFPNHAIIFLD